MFQALINLFKPQKPAPVEVRVEDIIKVEEPVAVVAEPVVEPAIVPVKSIFDNVSLPQTVVQNVADWPFPKTPPAEKTKPVAVKKQTKPTTTTKSSTKPAPKPVRKSK